MPLKPNTFVSIHHSNAKGQWQRAIAKGNDKLFNNEKFASGESVFKNVIRLVSQLYFKILCYGKCFNLKFLSSKFRTMVIQNYSREIIDCNLKFFQSNGFYFLFET